MASPITFSGLGSGLDTQAIISALLSVERIPIEQLEERKETEQKKLSLIGQLKGLVNTLHGKAKDLSTLSKFMSFSGSLSDAGAATVSASGSAQPGAHTLLVQSLASADRWAFDPVNDETTDLASADGQTVSFVHDGTTYTATVTQAASSLQDVAAAINAQTNGAVTASVVNTSSSATGGWELVLAANSTGTSQRITNIATTVAGLAIDATGPTGNTAGSSNNIIVGNDATAVIDGQTISRSDNDFSDVLTGVSLTLLEADPLTTHTLSVAADKDGIKKKLQGFVDSFNEVVKFVNKQNSYDEEGGPGGELFGDNILRSVIATMRSSLFGQSASQVAADTLGYGTLRLVGIEGQNDGTLTIDTSVLDDKMDANLDAFADLFADVDGFDNGGAALGTAGYYVDTTADTGLMDDLMRDIDRVVSSFNSGAGTFTKGLFDARTDALNSKIKLFDQQIDAKEFRLEAYQKQLVARFSALESTMARLQTQQAYLGSTFG